MHAPAAVLRTLSSITAAAIGLVVLLASPGSAAGPGSVAQLQSDLSSCTGTTATPYVEKLTTDLSDATAELVVGCAAVLDLDGHSLSLAHVAITPGDALRITDSSSGGAGHLLADATNSNDANAAITTSGAVLVIDAGLVEARASSQGAGIGSDGRGAGVGTITITGGTVVASGQTGSGAGIGGGLLSDAGGTVTVSGGRIVATGGDIYAAGIGSGNGGAAVPVRITGGNVVATSGANGGAGIGGGYESGTGAVTVSGGKVRASGRGGPGIGSALQATSPAVVDITGGTVVATSDETGIGAAGGAGPQVSISGGDVTASGSNAVGNVEYLAQDFGHLAVSGGVLRLPTGKLYIPDTDASGPEVTVSGTAVVTGSGGASPTYATVTGSGQIQNDAVIDLPTRDVSGGGVTVSHRHYDVHFEVGAGKKAPGAASVVTTYADTLAHGGRVLPKDPTPPAGRVFTGWVVLLPDGTQRLLGVGTGLTVFGAAAGTAQSDGLPVAAVATYRPVPTLTGVRAVGRILAVHQSTPGPAGAQVTYRWLRTRAGHTTEISGATAQHYRLRAADLGARVTAVVRVAQSTRRTTPGMSAPTAPIRRGTLRTPLAPLIKFPPRLHPTVGTSLVSALAHHLPQGHLQQLRHRFQWYAGPTRVGTNSGTLTITAAMIGKPIHLVVTYTARGYNPLAVTSNTTKSVRP